jgi:hypothetical protein
VQLKEIIEDEKNRNKGVWEIQKEVEDGEGVFDQANTSSVFDIIVSSITNKFENTSLDTAGRLRNAHPICQSTDDHVPGHKYSILGPL